ncbi:DNA internalization-related competence protein ComEC/Rec2 [Pediococcus ethanolidurans]|uniref:DNA internalization-related competence protein ComEC/Rec2 n=1 Tax=Pediococcus ethanolidurans TaxID=319653 RepID=UPI0021A99297|nr:DNA internalization-related competence protein ComEC/Rec2 [Pediococcus ethanolidurans]
MTSHVWLLVTVLIYWLFRVVCLRDRPMIYWTIAIGIFFAGLFWWHSASLKQHTMSNQANWQGILRVQPDEIKCQGDYFQFTGIDDDHHQLRVSGYLKTEQEKRRLEKIRHPVKMLVRGQIQTIDQPGNQNQFNYRTYCFSKGITNLLSKTTVVNWQKNRSTNPIEAILGLLHTWRNDMRLYCQQLPKLMQTYALSLLIGFKDEAFDEDMEGVTTLGLLHLFSLSGLHVFYFCSLLKQFFLRLRFAKETTNILLILFLPAFLIIGGGSGSLFRSIMMAELGILGAKLKRHTQLNVWSMTMLVNLAFDPYVILSMGGQLSYLLSFLLIFVGNYSSFKRAWVLNIVSLPIILFHTYQWHLLTSFANFLIIPIFSNFVMPLVIVSAATFWLMPQLSDWLTMGLQVFHQLVTLLSKLPGQIVFGKPTLGFTAILLIISLAWIAFPRYKKYFRWLLLGCYLSGFIWIHFPLHGEVTFVDVGQGDSILVRMPFNHSVTVIDTGGKVGFLKPAWAKGAEKKHLPPVLNYLHSLGISRIDSLCLSHQDADHIGDAGVLLSKIKVGQVIIPKGMENSRGFQTKVRPYLKKARLFPVLANQKIANLPFEIVHPFTEGKGENHDSLTLWGKFGTDNFIFSGDLDQAGEREIIAHYPQLQASIAKLGHHGSKTASAKDYLDKIRVKIGVISAGKNNHYGHPNPETLQTLKELKIQSLSTIDEGMISYYFTPQGFTNWRFVRRNYEKDTVH